MSLAAGSATAEVDVESAVVEQVVKRALGFD